MYIFLLHFTFKKPIENFWSCFKKQYKNKTHFFFCNVIERQKFKKDGSYIMSNTLLWKESPYFKCHILKYMSKTVH